jgi:hypothetical protein
LRSLQGESKEQENLLAKTEVRLSFLQLAPLTGG